MQIKKYSFYITSPTFHLDISQFHKEKDKSWIYGYCCRKVLWFFVVVFFFLLWVAHFVLNKRLHPPNTV